ncbi:hypothetical protein CRYUN_Cryun09bG0082400 [Craigia yunnanensis]
MTSKKKSAANNDSEREEDKPFITATPLPRPHRPLLPPRNPQTPNKPPPNPPVELALGSRERPVPKKARRGGGCGEKREDGRDWEESNGGEGFEEENWASVVDGAAEERLRKVEMAEEKKKKMNKVTRKATYFSDKNDEEE